MKNSPVITVSTLGPVLSITRNSDTITMVILVLDGITGGITEVLLALGDSLPQKAPSTSLKLSYISHTSYCTICVIQPSVVGLSVTSFSFLLLFASSSSFPCHIWQLSTHCSVSLNSGQSFNSSLIICLQIK